MSSRHNSGYKRTTRKSGFSTHHGPPKKKAKNVQSSLMNTNLHSTNKASPKGKQEEHPYIKFNAKHQYWQPKEYQFINGGLIWGYDRTEVKKDSWLNFLKRFKFEKVDEAPTRTNGSQPVIYQNPDGIIIIAEHEDQNRPDNALQLGYMRFEAPKTKEPQLKNVLSAFRGPIELKTGKSGKTTDFEEEDIPGGIATYIKEESSKGGFI